MDKFEKLKELIASYESAAVAFSAGVDSTFLLYAAREALGDKLVAVTASSCFFPESEAEEAEMICEKLNVRHIILKEDVLSVKGVKENPKDRCYQCKRELFSRIKRTAEENGLKEVIEGSNTDDTGDYRPGLKALSELGIKSPLRETGLGKAEIREISKKLGLKTWDKPSYACLASRIPYGEEITEEKLLRIDRAEQYLRELGFRQLRVRLYGRMARIELEPSDIQRALDLTLREKITGRFRELGFSHTALDLEGYRTGSLNVW